MPRPKMRRSDPATWLEVRHIALLKYGKRCACCGRSPATHPRTPILMDVLDKSHPLCANKVQLLCSDCLAGKQALGDTTDHRAAPSISPEAMEAARAARRALPSGASFEDVARAIFEAIIQEMQKLPPM